MPYRGPLKPCCRPCCALCRALCRLPPVMIQKLYRDSNPCRAYYALCCAHCRTCRSAPTPYRRALGAVSRHKAALFSRYKQLYRDTSKWPISTRAAARPARRLSVSQRLLVVLQGRVVVLLRAPARSGHACHDTTQCIMTQSWKMGSSPSSLFCTFVCFFFFSFHFFSLFHLLEGHKKSIFFSFSSRTS